MKLTIRVTIVGKGGFGFMIQYREARSRPRPAPCTMISPKTPQKAYAAYHLEEKRQARSSTRVARKGLTTCLVYCAIMFQRGPLALCSQTTPACSGRLTCLRGHENGREVRNVVRSLCGSWCITSQRAWVPTNPLEGPHAACRQHELVVMSCTQCSWNPTCRCNGHFGRQTVPYRTLF